MPDTLRNRYPLYAYLTLCLAWGTTYNAARVAVEHCPPFGFAGLRFLISGLLVLGFAKLTGAAFPSKRTDYAKLTLLGLLTITLAHGLTLYALQWVHSGVTAVTVSIGPVFVALLDSLRQRKSSHRPWGWAGLLMSVLGVWFLVVAGGKLGSIDAKGAAILITASLIFAFGQLYAKQVDATGDLSSQLGIQMLTSGFCFCIMSACMQEWPRIHFNSAVMWESMAYLIAVGSLAGYGAFFYLYRHWPAARAATYSYVNNIISVIIGALLLHEPVSVSVVLAMAIIMAGVVLVQFSHRHSPA